MDGRVDGEQGAETGDGGQRLIVKAEQVGDDAPIQFDADGVDGATAVMQTTLGWARRL